MTIEERAEKIYTELVNEDKRGKDLAIMVKTSYIQGAKEQHKIDIRKACEAVCSFCQDKEWCDAKSYDPIEHIRLAVSCEKIDKISEAMEE